MERKHSNRSPGNDGPSLSVKRKRAAMEDDDFTMMGRHMQKHARVSANSNGIQEHSSNISRPVTPPWPLQSPPPSSSAIDNPTDYNATEQPNALATVRFQNEAYNVVHVSDREINKLMQIGRVRIVNGKMFLKDSVDQE